jgi:hypothetical protein
MTQYAARDQPNRRDVFLAPRAQIPTMRRISPSSVCGAGYASAVHSIPSLMNEASGEPVSHVVTPGNKDCLFPGWLRARRTEFRDAASRASWSTNAQS